MNAFEPYVVPRWSHRALVADDRYCRFISTMETETISARNVVELLMQEEFNASICASKPSDDVPADYVYGWDC